MKGENEGGKVNRSEGGERERERVPVWECDLRSVDEPQAQSISQSLSNKPDTGTASILQEIINR